MFFSSPECCKVINLRINLVESSGCLGPWGCWSPGFRPAALLSPSPGSLCRDTPSVSTQNHCTLARFICFYHKGSEITEAQLHQKHNLSWVLSANSPHGRWDFFCTDLTVFLSLISRNMQTMTRLQIRRLYFISIRPHLITYSYANLGGGCFVPLFALTWRSSEWSNKPLSTLGEILEWY